MYTCIFVLLSLLKGKEGGGGWVALGSVSTKLDQYVGLNERTKQLTTLFIYEGNGIRPDTVPFLHPAC